MPRSFEFKMPCSVGLLVILLSATPALQAQTATAPSRGPDSVTKSFTPGIDVLPYPNLPFSGTDTIVETRPINGGGSVVNSLTARVVRDGQGRIYRERHHFAPQGADPQKSLYEFYILDPTASTQTDCTIATHQCVIHAYHPQLSVRLMPAGPFDQGKQLLVRDSLGERSIDDLNTIGTRETITVSPGTFGNDRPLTLTREFWYSPDLKTNLVVTRTDPRLGTFDIHLDVQSRDEPSPDIFAIPAGYTLHDARTPAQTGN
ncbi:MAG TPA: hypothetical protein VK814_02075 [Acidobacteriaceae bacterium]|nr:hypothetical protein [Acidobacteriaceae bacterium]